MKIAHNRYYARFYKKKGCIYMRLPTTPSVDREIYRRTASKTKIINLGARIYRGGTRL